MTDPEPPEQPTPAEPEMMPPGVCCGGAGNQAGAWVPKRGEAAVVGCQLCNLSAGYWRRQSS